MQSKGEMKVVNDQIVCPTYTLDLAKQMKKIIEKADYGIYHAVSDGSISWYDFAKEISPRKKIIPVTTEQFGSKANRLASAMLLTDKLKDLGIYCMRTRQEGLKDYLHEL